MSNDIVAGAGTSAPARASKTSTSTSKANSTTTAQKAPRPRRPNYAVLHAKPLPAEVYALPPLIPHNPLSVLSVVVTLLLQSIWPPSAGPVIHTGYFSVETQCVHITDAKAIRALWEQGFFGKGSLSRSEPRWLDQEKRKRGVDAALTSEEVTRKRREERRAFKLERARLEREAIEQQLREEGKLKDTVQNGHVDETAQGAEGFNDILTNGHAADSKDGKAEDEEAAITEELIRWQAGEDIEDLEYLQLSLEEAFFLAYGTGALNIHHKNKLLSSLHLLRLFASHAPFPSLDIASPIAPDNRFLLHYAAYHHYRSLGWVVRPGVKFGVDYLLYNRGPVFAHAEFAAIIIPSYSHAYWSEAPERKAECERSSKRDWWRFHRVNRVQTQALKTLVLVYVDVPPPWDEDGRGVEEKGIGNILKEYRVREFVVRRWIPNRNRD